MDRIIVFDGGNYIHRAIFSHLRNPNMPAPYTYMRMIIGELKKLDYTPKDTVIIAQDYGSWRKKFDSSYKSQRKDFRESKASAEWWKNIYNEFNEFFLKLDKAINWSIIKIFEIESDDVASVCCRLFKDKQIILVSSDKDLEMLLEYPNVKIFSPITKKFKIVKNPMKVLLDKIAKGDISDNLLTKPSNEMEFEIRKKIVNLLELPEDIEQKIKEVLLNLPFKNLIIEKIPYRSVRVELKKLYEGDHLKNKKTKK